MRIFKRDRAHTAHRCALAALAGVALSVGFVAPALAAGGPPIGPVYDCFGYSGAVSNYVTAFQLKSATTYLLAPTRKGNSLSGPVVKGTYTLRGSKLTFLTGPYGKIHWYGLWKLRTLKNGGDQRHIALYTAKGVDSGMECYPYPQ